MCDDTQAQKAADIEFFDKTKAACHFVIMSFIIVVLCVFVVLFICYYNLL